VWKSWANKQFRVLSSESGAKNFEFLLFSFYFLNQNFDLMQLQVSTTDRIAQV